MAAAVLLALGGCGFQPLYGSSGETADGGTIPDKLRQVYVAGIPERYGQELRLFLQQDMAGSAPENPTGYTLQVSSFVMNESLDIHQDNTSGRTRATGHAHWILQTVAPAPVVLAQGDAQAMDGENETYEQYFAQNLNQATLARRVANALAERITQQVAIWFRTKAPPPQQHVAGPRPSYVDPNVMPNSSTDIQEQSVGEDGMPAMAIGRTNPNPSGTSESQPANGTIGNQ
ncbi:hypothetical protein HLH28_16110 [Gluconacetobacter tumulisoli]|uniref:LPS-assembly lipoprotein n=1 Tax=Gluconacetobacter tumulisoli TaxID=1286189 RepID=A0A7W4K9Y5_9PROT|nr:hypothetical protein [Gluconacetobacter tumulisoli]